MNTSDPTRRSVVRNAPWMAMAVLIHVALIAIFSVIYLSGQLAEDPQPATTIRMAASELAADAPALEPPAPVDRHAIPKSEAAEVVTFDELVRFPQPADPLPEEDLALRRGVPSALLDDHPPGPSGGTAIGVGRPGHHGLGTSTSFGRRPGADGGIPGGATGALQGTHAAVLDGLRWLLRHRNSDGSWGSSFADQCAGDGSCKPPELALSAGHDVGLTGLALLAFLGAGSSHESRQTLVDPQLGKRHVLGQTIKDGLLWLVQHQDPDGAFTAGERPNMYDQALATMALCENYGLTRNETWL